ncbi:MAG TPA: L,D-transpeptidase family protein [Vicinamibacterales bacterium]
MSTSTRASSLIAVLALATAALAATGERPILTGDVRQYQVMRGDTLGLVAARFGLEAPVLARDNGLKANARLQVGDTLEIDNRHIVPQGYDDGIVVNLPQRRLFLFRNGALQESYPVAVGSGGWKTPTGDFSVIEKEVDPAWNVPASIQAEMAREGKPVVTRVGPGPDNPLGSRWIRIHGAIGIHGTNAPSSIFKYTTHGCIRMATEDVEHLFELIREGDPVAVIYEPVLAAKDGGDVFVEVHRDPYGRGGVSRAALAKALEAAGAGEMASHPELAAVLKQREGRAVSLTARATAAAER